MNKTIRDILRALFFVAVLVGLPLIAGLTNIQPATMILLAILLVALYATWQIQDRLDDLIEIGMNQKGRE